MPEEWWVGDWFKVESDGNDQVFCAYWRGRYVARYERAEWGWSVENMDDLLLLSDDERTDYEWCRKQWMVRMRRVRAN